MATLVQRLLRPQTADRYSLEDYANWVSQFSFNGNTYATGLNQSISQQGESAPQGYEQLVRAAHDANGVVFACLLVRLQVFSAIRLQWQQMDGGRPGDLTGNNQLAMFERPWVGGTTQDLLARMIQDADLAGNSYWIVHDGELVRLRPDWVVIAAMPRLINGRHVGDRRVGYLYYEGGLDSKKTPVAFDVSEVAHFAPQPDPLASFRGMSWLSPVIREIQGDKMMTVHKNKFFENGATPNLAVKLDPTVGLEVFKQFKEEMDSAHVGMENAYKTLYLGGGADVTVVGNSFEQMNFKTVQGHGETRIAAAAGVPPVIVGLSEGLQAATYSNYAQARRRFADGTMHPLWQNAAGSLEVLVRSRRMSTSRLWYDARDVPFLREDEKDAAEIQSVSASTIARLTEAGFRPDIAVRAVTSGDLTQLGTAHTGMFSVQLQTPGAEQEAPQGPDVDDTEVDV